MKKIESAIKEKKRLKDLFKDKPEELKGTIIVVILSFALVFMLFMPILNLGDASIDLSVNISGINLMVSAFGSWELSKTVPGIGTITVLLPKLPAVLLLLSYLLLAFSIALVILFSYTKYKTKQSKVLKITGVILSVYFSVIYIVLITAKGVKAVDIYGATRIFYQVYSLSASYLVGAVLTFFATAIAFMLKLKEVGKVRKNLIMYILLIVPVSLMFVFNIYPMFLQVILSLKKYVIADGVWGSSWVGLQNFKTIFTDSDMFRIIGNTVLISVSRILVGIIPPIILAIFLFDMGRERYRKGVQTILYIPHFFSWVVIYGIAYAFINPEGLINNIIVAFGGTPIKILTSESKFIPLLLFTDLWKELGWGTILYIAALSNVDPSLYESAAIDGAGAWKKLIHITLPGIAPTIVFVSVMSVGNVLRGAGFEQIMLFGSENMKIAQVIDTWVIWKGLDGLEYGLGAAVSFFQSAIGLILVLLCNKFSKRYVGIGLF